MSAVWPLFLVSPFQFKLIPSTEAFRLAAACLGPRRLQFGFSGQDFLPGFRQLEGHQAPADEGGEGQQDGDDLSDANEGCEDEAGYNGCKLTDPVENAERRAPVETDAAKSTMTRMELYCKPAVISRSSNSCPAAWPQLDCGEGRVDGGRLELPLGGRVELHRNDLQAVPGCHADAVEEALPAYDGSLAEAQQQQKGAGRRHQHGPT